MIEIDIKYKLTEQTKHIKFMEMIMTNQTKNMVDFISGNDVMLWYLTLAFVVFYFFLSFVLTSHKPHFFLSSKKKKIIFSN